MIEGRDQWMECEKPFRRYDVVARSLHWLTVLLLIVQFTIAWTMPHVHRGTVPAGLIGWHLSVGIAILGVVIFRLYWRIFHPQRVTSTPLPPILKIIPHLCHITLYALLVSLPLLGWVNASARGWVVSLFGIPLPPLAGHDSALGLRLGDVHQTAALAFLTIVGLHVLGVAYHLFARDGTVQKML